MNRMCVRACVCVYRAHALCVYVCVRACVRAGGHAQVCTSANVRMSIFRRTILHAAIKSPLNLEAILQ